MGKIALPDVSLWSLGSGLETIGGIGIRMSESQYPANVLAHANIVSFWQMENNWLDSAGSNHGTPQGGIGFTSDSIIGTHSGLFDGVDDYVTVGTDASLDIESGPFAIEDWIRPENWTDEQQVLFATADVNGFGLFLTMNRGAGEADNVDLGKSGVIDQTVTIEWPSYDYGKRGVHLVVNQHHNGSNPTFMEVFINKVSQGTFVNTSNYNSAAGKIKQIGHLTVGGMRDYKGVNDSLAIYSDVLSQSDIDDHYDKRYVSSLPVAESPQIAIAETTLDATTPINILINQLATLLRISPATILWQYALNSGAYNGVWITHAAMVTALQGATITNHTNSLRLKAQFTSDQTQGGDIVIASQIVASGSAGITIFQLPLEIIDISTEREVIEL